MKSVISSCLIAIMLVFSLMIEEAHAQWQVNMDGNTYIVNEFRVQDEHLWMLTDTTAYRLKLATMAKAKNHMKYTYRSVTKPHDLILLDVKRLSTLPGVTTSKLGRNVNGYMITFIYMTSDHPINVLSTNFKQEFTDLGVGVLTFDGGTYHLTSKRLRQFVKKYPGQTMNFPENLAKYGQQALVNSAVFR